jgi:hypothetical protein
MTTSSGKYPSFNVTTGPVMPTGLDMQTLAIEAASHLNDAPTDGQLYGRESGAWIVVPTGGGGGITDAPSDGTLYGRKSAAWVYLTHNDITDWAAQLANYYPTSNPSGYQTAAQVTASLGPYALTSALANYLPLSGGTVTGGTQFSAGIILPGPGNFQVGGGTAGNTLISNGTTCSWGAPVPQASAILPVVDGVATTGTSAAFSREDHVHPLPSQAMGDNRLINGDMRIDQRNNGASGTAGTAAGVYTVDRWIFNSSPTTPLLTWGRNLLAAATPDNFPYYLGFQSSSTHAVAPNDQYCIRQYVEADMISDFAWGKPSTKSVTLSFLAQSSLTGNFGGAIGSARCYPFLYSLPVANTWTPISITIPGDIGAGWTLSGNGRGLYVSFDLGCGANNTAAPGAWANANVYGANGGVSLVSTNGATLFITGVKLEVGSVATPYNRQSMAKSMADCQRYYQSGILLMTGYISAAGANYQLVKPFPVVMRAAPTATIVANNNANLSSFVLNTNVSEMWNSATVTAVGNVTINVNYTVSAEL